MTEHKGDEFLRTGAHRAWTGEPIGHVRNNRLRDVQRNWIDQSQLPANPRHAAITRTLSSWSNYKSWTDKVRGSWDKDKDKDEKK